MNYYLLGGIQESVEIFLFTVSSESTETFGNMFKAESILERKLTFIFALYNEAH